MSMKPALQAVPELHDDDTLSALVDGELSELRLDFMTLLDVEA